MIYNSSYAIFHALHELRYNKLFWTNDKLRTILNEIFEQLLSRVILSS